MNKIISIANIKGGVGKSTISINLAGYFSRNLNTFLVDADPQGTSTDWSRKKNKNIENNLTISKHYYTFNDLKNTLPTESKKYDITILDCPPEEDKVLRLAIVQSDYLIIPITPSPFDIPSAKKTIDIVKEAAGKKITEVETRLLVSKKIVGTVLGKDIKETLELFKIPILKTEISQRVALCEAGIKGDTIFEYEPKSKAAKEFTELGKEVKKWLNQN